MRPPVRVGYREPVNDEARGYSALELAVVMGIVAVVLAVAYPRVATLAAGYRLEGAARNLALVLQKVRLRAIAEGVCFRITFDGSAKTYQVQQGSAGGSACPSVTYTNDGSAQSIDDVSSVALSATASPVFDTRGACSTTSVVTLTGRTGGIRLVAVNSAGRVNIQ